MDNLPQGQDRNLWKDPAGGESSPGKPAQTPHLDGSSDDDRHGRALFNFKDVTYLVTFLKEDPARADFVPLDDLPWYKGLDKPDRDVLE